MKSDRVIFAAAQRSGWRRRTHEYEHDQEQQRRMEPTTRVELVTRRLRNSSAPRKLLKDLGCISTLWGIENRFGRKMCNTLCNGRLDYIAR